MARRKMKNVMEGRPINHEIRTLGEVEIIDKKKKLLGRSGFSGLEANRDETDNSSKERSIVCILDCNDCYMRLIFHVLRNDLNIPKE